MAADSTTDKSFLVTHRLWIIIGAMALTLPQLAVIFQVTQDGNLCGTWCTRMFFPWRNGTSLGNYFSGWTRAYMGVALVFGMVITTILVGRYWCSHICPIGGSMEAGSRLVPKFLKINYSKVPAPSFRYGYMLVYMALPILGLGSLCCGYCNFATIPRLFGAAFIEADMAFFLRTSGWINLGLVAVLGVFAKGGRAYCNTICPIGAIDALANRFGPKFGKRMGVIRERCNGCARCSEVCPTWAIEMENGEESGRVASIDQLSCMPCRKCEKVCPTEAIAYGKTEA
jgi:Fe-S-cluster-containing hydrogenase component 2